MKLRILISVAAIFSIFSSVTPVAAAVPIVNTFTVAATATSPVPVTAFTASDSDGTVVGYMITQTSSRPAASDSRWTATPWSSFTTTSIGALTIYAWAKDNANGVSNSKTAATNMVGSHEHTMAQVTGLTTALAGKADISHNHDAVYQKKYANVVVVAKSGGDYTDPVIAMNSVTNASEANPYLLKIMPGIYDLGSNTLFMKQFVDIEGAGEGITKITSTQVTAWEQLHGTVDGANNSELRFLTIENRGGNAFQNGIAIYVSNASTRIKDVTAVAFNAWAVYTIFISNGAAPVLSNATVTAYAGSEPSHAVVILGGSQATIARSSISASDGIYPFGINSQGSLTITDSQVSGTGIGIYHSGAAVLRADRCTFEGSSSVVSYPEQDIKIGSSKLIGPTGGGTGGAKCVASYDGNYAPLDATCQLIP